MREDLLLNPEEIQYIVTEYEKEVKHAKELSLP